MKPLEAYFLARFLDRMLKWKPEDRPTAAEMLKDPWLKLPDDWDPYVSRRHLREIKKATQAEYSLSQTSSSDEPGSEGEESESESWQDCDSQNVESK